MRGDPKNLTYGTLHKYSIPRYHRAGYGRIVGLPRGIKIDRDLSSTSELVLERNGFGGAVDKSRTLASMKPTKNKDGRQKLVRIDRTEDSFAANDAFLSIRRTRKRKRGSPSPTEDALDYRSIEGKANPMADSDSDLTSDDSDEARHDAEDTIRKQHASLIKATQSHPSDEQVWKTLIDFQCKLVRPDLDPEHFSSTQRKTLADLRLHMYDKALKVLNGKARIDMLEAMLTEGAILWDTASRVEKWRKALDDNPSASTLWIRYLDMIQRPSSVPKYETTRNSVVSILYQVNALRRNTKNHLDTAALKVTHVHVLLRLLRFMADAGYDEHAIAIIQSAVSLHLTTTNNTNPFADRVNGFETVWDDEGPRFGDEEPATQDPQASHVAGRDSPKWRNLGSFTSFVNRERHFHDALELPGRTNEEYADTAGDDAFHIILFSDIKEIVTATSAGLQQECLLDGILAFFDLPSLSGNSVTPFPWRTDPSMFRLMRNGEDRDPLLDRVGGPTPNVANLFSRSSSTFPESLTARRSTLAFLRRGLEQLLSHDILGPSLRPYFIAFCTKYTPDTAAKTARRLVKQYPTDVHLYNAAAHTEAVLGNYQKAVQLWSSSIAVFKKAAMVKAKSNNQQQTWHDQATLTLLCHDWAWTEMDRGDTASAAKALTAAIANLHDDGDAAISASTRLALQRDLSSGFDAALLRQDIPNILLFTSSLCLLTYLTSSDPLPSALSTLSSHITALQSSTFHQTSPTQSQSLLVQLHLLQTPLIKTHLSLHRPYRPTHLLSSLTTSLTLFPSNPTLLSLYATLTSPLDLLSSHLHNLSRPWLQLDHTSPLPNWCYAIDQALRRLAQGSGTRDAVRSLFRRALLTDGSRVAHAPGLWGAWLDFELGVLGEVEGRVKGVSTSTAGEGRKAGGWAGRKEEREVETQVAIVRGVFFDGLRGLPLNKEWVLRGLEVFDTDGAVGMGRGELEGVYHLLFEREMRVRVEMEG
ncbi:NRDE-2, necessary for RNA interference-domain-containing protein [Elsinoe ampelina]|uniref:NRDE-2, necessary for RNA interference-domain-containing protein n=1 Tax=Elsinoe ampelina TaxID=302913 RepID=A0A6A6GAU7_9PEZI|nr:NRDE-2, necessary for RNA interference-domain-containing protein [Elsinoe ampelina]